MWPDSENVIDHVGTVSGLESSFQFLCFDGDLMFVLPIQTVLGLSPSFGGADDDFDSELV